MRSGKSLSRGSETAAAGVESTRRAEDLAIFLVAPPGLEAVLAEEATDWGFCAPRAVAGGVETSGPWSEVWRANLVLRGASRVLVRIAAFRAPHLAQLDRRARRVPWGEVLRPDRPVSVEATCRRSKIYHAGAAAQRIGRAIREELGAPVVRGEGLRLLARIEDDLCTLSVDSSGELLHKRGHKQAVGKAPMRESLAALFLRSAGFRGTEPVVDPMCGAGTFPIEAAEIAQGLLPGRDRAFAFEDLARFDAEAWAALRAGAARPAPGPGHVMTGMDRDAGAVRRAEENAARAGVGGVTAFSAATVSEIAPPEGAPGLVIVNPPYGARLGDVGALRPLYAALGQVLRARFGGWRAAVITSESGLARATELAFRDVGPPVPHGGIRVRLHRTGTL